MIKVYRIPELRVLTAGPRRARWSLRFITDPETPLESHHRRRVHRDLSGLPYRFDHGTEVVVDSLWTRRGDGPSDLDVGVLDWMFAHLPPGFVAVAPWSRDCDCWGDTPCTPGAVGCGTVVFRLGDFHPTRQPGGGKILPPPDRGNLLPRIEAR